ncbi:hypothetical protein K6U52_04895, partial [Vibrio vulnificus]|uniref:hypothetical protein n=1 Tax=Vibrio vulnificus TaxID=672 RepID=UPI001EEA5274
MQALEQRIDSLMAQVKEGLSLIHYVIYPRWNVLRLNVKSAVIQRMVARLNLVQPKVSRHRTSAV